MDKKIVTTTSSFRLSALPPVMIQIVFSFAIDNKSPDSHNRVESFLLIKKSFTQIVLEWPRLWYPIQFQGPLTVKSSGAINRRLQILEKKVLVPSEVDPARLITTDYKYRADVRVCERREAAVGALLGKDSKWVAAQAVTCLVLGPGDCKLAEGIAAGAFMPNLEALYLFGLYGLPTLPQGRNQFPALKYLEVAWASGSGEPPAFDGWLSSLSQLTSIDVDCIVPAALPSILNAAPQLASASFTLSSGPDDGKIIPIDHAALQDLVLIAYEGACSVHLNTPSLKRLRIVGDCKVVFDPQTVCSQVSRLEYDQPTSVPLRSSQVLSHFPQLGILHCSMMRDDAQEFKRQLLDDLLLCPILNEVHMAYVEEAVDDLLPIRYKDLDWCWEFSQEREAVRSKSTAKD